MSVIFKNEPLPTGNGISENIRLLGENNRRAIFLESEYKPTSVKNIVSRLRNDNKNPFPIRAVQEKGQVSVFYVGV